MKNMFLVIILAMLLMAVPAQEKTDLEKKPLMAVPAQEKTDLEKKPLMAVPAQEKTDLEKKPVIYMNGQEIGSIYASESRKAMQEFRTQIYQDVKKELEKDISANTQAIMKLNDTLSKIDKTIEDYNIALNQYNKNMDALERKMNDRIENSSSNIQTTIKAKIEDLSNDYNTNVHKILAETRNIVQSMKDMLTEKDSGVLATLAEVAKEMNNGIDQHNRNLEAHLSSLRQSAKQFIEKQEEQHNKNIEKIESEYKNAHGKLQAEFLKALGQILKTAQGYNEIAKNYIGDYTAFLGERKEQIISASCSALLNKKDQDVHLAFLKTLEDPDQIKKAWEILVPENQRRSDADIRVARKILCERLQKILPGNEKAQDALLHILRNDESPYIRMQILDILKQKVPIGDIIVQLKYEEKSGLPEKASQNLIQRGEGILPDLCKNLETTTEKTTKMAILNVILQLQENGKISDGSYALKTILDLYKNAEDSNEKMALLRGICIFKLPASYEPMDKILRDMSDNTYKELRENMSQVIAESEWAFNKMIDYSPGGDDANKEEFIISSLCKAYKADSKAEDQKRKNEFIVAYLNRFTKRYDFIRNYLLDHPAKDNVNIVLRFQSTKLDDIVSMLQKFWQLSNTHPWIVETETLAKAIDTKTNPIYTAEIIKEDSNVKFYIGLLEDKRKAAKIAKQTPESK